MERYSVFLSRAAYDVITSLRRIERDRLLRFLDALELDPFQKGDYEVLDASLRPHQIKIVGDLAVVYWADHPVEEVKVEAIRPADR